MNDHKSDGTGSLAAAMVVIAVLLAFASWQQDQVPLPAQPVWDDGPAWVDGDGPAWTNEEKMSDPPEIGAIESR